MRNRGLARSADRVGVFFLMNMRCGFRGRLEGEATLHLDGHQTDAIVVEHGAGYAEYGAGGNPWNF
jgi:hypothetical protein